MKKEHHNHKRAPLFVIRDDDLSCFSTPADIEWWYADAFKKNVPVTFSTIPFVCRTSDAHLGQNVPEDDREHPFSENQQLVEYVKSNPHITIAQHGTTHVTSGGVYEYAQHRDLTHDVARGKEELESALSRQVTMFVAPHDSLSNQAIQAIESNGMDIIRSKGSRNFLPRFAYVRGLIRMIMHRITHPDRHAAPAYPYVVDFGKHKEAYGSRLESGSKQLRTWLEWSFHKGGNFILVNHLHDRSEEKKRVLYELIEYAETLGFVCAKGDALFMK